jgi:uncharacterized membrane protein HdeD (DUF308 family)
MESKEQHMIPIWFFIGINVLVCGVVILATGVMHFNNPPQNIVLSNLHADVWWGAFMTVVGLFYTVRFFPRRSLHTALDEPPTDNIAAKGTKWE